MSDPNSLRYVALIPAAGAGARMGAALPKQYLSLGGKPVLRHTVDAFLNFPAISEVLVVVSPEDGWVDQVLPQHPRLRVLRCGGATRRDTVRNGLRHWQGQLGAQDWVLVHDAARPGINAALLEKLIAEVGAHPVGGLLALPVVDTVKRAADGRVATLARDGLWLAQTPQMFRYQLLCAALDGAAEVTDEASAVEAAGHVPLLVCGHACNLKITVPADLPLAYTYLASQDANVMNNQPFPPFRTGQGYDCHALVPGRKLIIGGVTIPHPAGLLGHSDADVLLHAVTDALLGAAGLGDIGRHFPDTDARFAGADSRVLLREAYLRVRQAGFRLGNLDATVIAQVPKLAPHIAAMAANLAEDLAVAVSQINIKAKTNEKLGYLGREEGIAAEAAVLVFAGAGD